jgi:hypothetical protein
MNFQFAVDHKLRLRITGFLDFAHRPLTYKLENKPFRKVDLFPATGEEMMTHTLLGPIERANLNYMSTRFIITKAASLREITRKCAVKAVMNHIQTWN